MMQHYTTATATATADAATPPTGRATSAAGDTYGRWGRDAVWQAFHRREPDGLEGRTGAKPAFRLAQICAMHLRWCAHAGGASIRFNYLWHNGSHSVTGRDHRGDGVDVEVAADGSVRVTPYERWRPIPQLVEVFRWNPASGNAGGLEYRAEPWSRHNGWLPFQPLSA